MHAEKSLFSQPFYLKLHLIHQVLNDLMKQADIMQSVEKKFLY